MTTTTGKGNRLFSFGSIFKKSTAAGSLNTTLFTLLSVDGVHAALGQPGRSFSERSLRIYVLIRTITHGYRTANG